MSYKPKCVEESKKDDISVHIFIAIEMSMLFHCHWVGLEPNGQKHCYAQDKCHHYCKTENTEKKYVLEYQNKKPIYMTK